MVHPEFEAAKAKYNQFREWFYEMLSHYETWDEYLAELNKSIEVRYNPNDKIEQFLKEYYINILTKRFLEKHPFLEPYARRGPDQFIMESEGGAVKVRVEMYNVSQNELYYPNFLEVISVHSARHSLAMFLKEGILNPQNRGKKLGLYSRPLTTHPGDREFTHYYLSALDFPHVILTRMENLSWFLQVNGLMKQSQFGGRWCTRVFKLETSTMLYRRYFYSWEYSFTKNRLIEYCTKHNIFFRKSWSRQEIVDAIKARLRTGSLIAGMTLEPPNHTVPKINNTEYPLFSWDAEMKEWINTGTSANIFPVYEKLYKPRGNTQQHIGWQLTDKTLKVNNIIESLGMNKYHSKSRRMMNPNITLSPKSRPTSNFFIYLRLPLYWESPKVMQQIIARSPIPLNENPFEKEHPLAYVAIEEDTPELVPETEERFGCIICPYRLPEYYKNLYRNWPWEYFYCMAIRLVASARNIITEGREYWYEGKEPQCPTM